MAKRIYDGRKDSTNYFSEKFLEINSVGTQIMPTGTMTVRERGRVDYHLFIVIKGACAVKHGGDTKILGEGCFAFYYPGEPQSYEAVCDSRSFWLHFSGTAAEELLSELGLSSGAYNKRCDARVIEKLSEITGYVKNDGTKMLAVSALIEVLHSLSATLANRFENSIPSTILSSIAYINMNYDKSITVDELAHISGYSKSRFSHLFSASMNTTPIKYQTALRLDSAREMLTATNASIGEIAALCGFPDQLYFSRVFKKEFGISPSEYKSGKEK